MCFQKTPPHQIGFMAVKISRVQAFPSSVGWKLYTLSSFKSKTGLFVILVYLTTECFLHSVTLASLFSSVVLSCFVSPSKLLSHPTNHNLTRIFLPFLPTSLTPTSSLLLRALHLPAFQYRWEHPTQNLSQPERFKSRLSYMCK